MTKKTEIYGFKVFYEENAVEGVRYLRDDLDYKESKVFFDNARSNKLSEFEDDEDRQFTLIYSKGEYILNRRK